MAEMTMDVWFISNFSLYDAEKALLSCFFHLFNTRTFVFYSVRIFRIIVI
jgi:hypothetical protein